ncbi:MAG TPA: hypothetical protein VGE21_10830 [Flavobacteriales bacterium]
MHPDEELSPTLLMHPALPQGPFTLRELRGDWALVTALSTDTEHWVYIPALGTGHSIG